MRTFPRGDGAHHQEETFGRVRAEVRILTGARDLGVLPPHIARQREPLDAFLETMRKGGRAEGEGVGPNAPKDSEEALAEHRAQRGLMEGIAGVMYYAKSMIRLDSPHPDLERARSQRPAGSTS